MDKIKIMLIEDHNVFRQGMKRLIELEENMTVVAEAGSCREALQKVSDQVDIVLLDIGLPDGDGLDLCAKIRTLYPGIRYIALTTYDDAIFIKKAMERCISGFVPKYAFFEEIRWAILMTHKGGTYLYPGLGVDKLINLSDPGLSEAELKILQLLAAGKNQKEIAESLFMSLSTFRRRLNGICSKLKVGTVEELITAAAKKGLIK